MFFSLNFCRFFSSVIIIILSYILCYISQADTDNYMTTMNVNVYENVDLYPNFIHHKSRLVSATGGVESVNISNLSISLFYLIFLLLFVLQINLRSYWFIKLMINSLVLALKHSLSFQL